MYLDRTSHAMLDESIYNEVDIDRPADIDGIRSNKLNLKKFGGTDRLKATLERVRAHGM